MALTHPNGRFARPPAPRRHLAMMQTWIVLLYILFVAAALILTVVILLQEGKGGGFGDSLGAAGQQAFGVKASGVQRFTMYIAIAFLGSAVLIHVLNNRSQSSSGDIFGDEGAPATGTLDPGTGAPAGAGGAASSGDSDKRK